MNKDDLEFCRRLKSFQPVSKPFDLLKVIENRKVGLHKQNAAIPEDLGLFAEEKLVKKEEFDEMRCEMPGQPRSTFLMVFSPDGSHSASTHGNHNIYVTDLRSGKHVRTLVGHPRTPWCIAFHPTSNQIVASGCLGGQVRIWDLSGGSEVWTAENQTVIASLAFHPSDRVLVIATYNEVYFWDWSRPEPFAHVATSNAKEKVRYVAFDSLGHKLITGIANSPQTRWERVRAPVPIAHQGYGVSSYRRRITQRLQDPPVVENSTNPPAPRHSLTSVPERERRITVCYRNLVREYEQLVHRYLQLYRPPTMIDRGTDPMEPNSTSQNHTVDLTRSADDSAPSTSGVSGTSHNENQVAPAQQTNANQEEPPSTPSTSNNPNIKSQSLLTPSKIFSVVSKPSVLIQGTQTESRKHKFESNSSELPNEKRFKKDEGECSTSVGTPQLGTSSAEDQSGRSAAPSAADTSSSTSEFYQASSSPGTSSSHRTLKLSGSSAFTEPVKIRSAQEKRQRNVDDEQIGAKPEGSAEATPPPVTEAAPSTSRTPNAVQGSPDSAEPPRGKRFKTSDNVDSQAGTPPETPSASEPVRSAGFPGRNQQNYLPAMEPSSLQSHRGRILRETIALTRARCNLLYRSGNTATGRDAPQTSNGSTTATTSGLSNTVGDLLLGIRRTAEEEVRSRILPIITSVPPNDRPELIRLFENSREHLRMRFRQMYPVFIRKTNRRMLNLADTSSDNNSSSDEEPSNNRHVRRNSEPTSSPGATPARNPAPSVSSTNSTASTVAGGTDVRNFNTELEQLVTSLLNELDRAENDPRTTSSGGATDSNETTQTDNGSDQVAAQNPEETSNATDSRPPLNIPTTSRTPDSTAEDSSVNLINTNTSGVNTSTFTTSSFRSSTSSTRTSQTQYSVYAPRRRRLFPCRISAFMPTRVNCFRPPPRLRRSGNLFRARLGASDNVPPSSSSTFDLDQLINYSERENSEDETIQQPLDLSNHPNPDSPDLDNVYSNIRLGNVYSNIIQDLESSLNDVIRMRASNRPGETSDMLGSFSERLESIMNQSDTILRNLSNSMEMLSSATGEPGAAQFNEPRLSFFDPDFYVRDQRTDNNLQELNRESTINLTDIFSAVAADHTYPRNPDLARSTNRGDGLSPLMTSIHMTISHIQRQARLLRQQVESIERIDRAMLEVAQLQLIRHLNVDLLRYLRTPNGESRSTGMSSVRQMMAGTRISDSSPYESPAEDSRTNQQASQPTTSSAGSSTSTTGGGGSGSGGAGGANASNWNQPTRSRSLQRKIYPPGRVYRMSRHCRKQPIVHFLSRRYTSRSERNSRPAPPPRLASRLQQHEPSTSSARQESHPNYTYINSYTLSSIARRLENLLMDQMRVFTNLQARPPPSPPTNRSSSMVDLGEHILATRLHGCVLRVNRLWDNNQSVRADSSAAVTQDGESRYGARHTLSTIIESMSRYFEEVGSSNIPQSIKLQIHSVLVMALLLTELLLLVIVDSIPPPSGINLIPERAFLTSRIDHMCNQMLQSRNFYLSHQLTRSLRLVKLTMRHAHRLGQSYHARRNAMLPRNNLERRQLLGSINRCLRTINRRRQPPEHPTPASAPVEPSTSNQDPTGLPERTEPPPPPPGQSSTSAHIREWYSTLIDVLSLYRLNRSNRNLNSSQNRDANTASNRSSNTDPPEPSAATSSSSERVPEQTWTFSDEPTRESSEPNVSPVVPNEPTRQSEHGQVGRESPREPSRYPYPYLTWNRERGLSSNLNRNTTTNSSPANGSSQWRGSSSSSGGGDARENRMNRIIDEYLNNRVQELNSMQDNTDGDGDDTDDTENSNSTAAQNARPAPGPPRMMRFLNVPAVQVNDVPVPVSEPLNFSHSHRFITQRQRFADRVSELRSNPNMGLFRPRFLHPLYASVNPFDADLDDPQREQIYDSDMITTVTPNHRIQAWDVSDWNVPAISNARKNVVVGECKIHNDASVDIAKDGTILVTLLPSGGYLNVTNRLGVYSLKWETLGQCLYTTSFEQNAVSVSLSPLSRHLVVGLTHRIITSERWVMARVFKIPKVLPGDRLPVLRELEQSRDSRINCIRWLPVSGQGLIYATNTGQLVILS